MQTAEGQAPWLDAVVMLEKNGELPLRMFVSWDWHTHQLTRFSHEEMDDQIAKRKKYETAKIKPNYVKIFADGTPIGRQSLFIEPYADDPSAHGTMNFTPEELKEAIIAFDAQGIACFVHSVGDGTTRAVLDAIEAARQTNGFNGPRHKIAHPTYIHPDDMRRFTQIPNVAAIRIIRAGAHSTSASA